MPSALKPVCHGLEVPIPEPPDRYTGMSSDSDDEQTDADIDFENTADEINQPKPFTQGELNDLTRDLCLSKESAQLLGSRLREKNLLAPGTTFYWYRDREKEFRVFFEKDKNTALVYCTNITGLIEALGLRYDANEWRLFIDSSSKSLKAVLLFNGNKVSSVPVGHSVQMTESYDNMERLLTALKYRDHNWQICGDLKVCSPYITLKVVLFFIPTIVLASFYYCSLTKIFFFLLFSGNIFIAWLTRRLHQIPLFSVSMG